MGWGKCEAWPTLTVAHVPTHLKIVLASYLTHKYLLYIDKALFHYGIKTSRYPKGFAINHVSPVSPGLGDFA